MILRMLAVTVAECELCCHKMSDLMPTPSQTQSTVSSEAFEALIDLLASDAIDDNPTSLPRPRTLAQTNVMLRDSSGRLDFDKIRSMFAVQDESHGATTTAKPFVEEDAPEPTTLAMESDCSDDDRQSQRSASPLTIALSRSNSRSPQRVDHRNTVHHRSSTFGDQPWTGILEDQRGYKEAMPPSLLHQPLSFNELNTALTSAHAEVNSLRQQYDELRVSVSKRLGTGTWAQAKSSQNAANTERTKPAHLRGDGPQTHPVATSPPLRSSSDMPPEIAHLTEDEAKVALEALTRMLNLSPTTILSLAKPISIAPTPAGSSPHQLNLPSPNQTPHHDITSITRALHFLSTVDELVWRRSLSSSRPCSLQPTFAEENVTVLLARLELWERAVRTSSRI
ncbi:hypothetical protein BS17DRAFT_437212 [Gyrodon lividus]|nr:hypothetical protein BS17DRAFT_437212 [Gyrodon lividus]